MIGQRLRNWLHIAILLAVFVGLPLLLGSLHSAKQGESLRREEIETAHGRGYDQGYQDGWDDAMNSAPQTRRARLAAPTTSGRTTRVREGDWP